MAKRRSCVVVIRSGPGPDLRDGISRFEGRSGQQSTTSTNLFASAALGLKLLFLWVICSSVGLSGSQLSPRWPK